MNIKVEKIDSMASCNACDAANYRTADNRPVDDIYSLKIGMMNNRLCKGCMVCLVGAIALEIDLLNAE